MRPSFLISGVASGLRRNLSMTLAVDQDLIFPANAHTRLVFSSEVTV